MTLPALTSFPLFPKFSPEIRLRIWKLAAFPRVVTILCTQHRLSPRMSYPACLNSPDIPAILHVCRESRHEADYVKTFNIGLTSWPSYIWVNWDLDTFKMDDRELRLMSAEERSQIHRLILSVKTSQDFGWNEEMKVHQMKALHDFTILSAECLQTWGDRLKEWEERLVERFGKDETWKCPSMRIIDVVSGDYLNRENCREKARAIEGKGNCSRRGCGGS